MKLWDLFTMEELQEALQNKLVKFELHPTLPLVVYNYTAHCQFEWTWNNVTLQCRGLITDMENNVVARPLKKFFTLEQLGSKEDLKGFLEHLATEEFEAQEKMDGSMLVVARYNGETVVSTRGSFVSEQALRGRKILERYGIDLVPEGYTYIFEVIYPENRVVVDYKGLEDVILLAVINTETGEEEEPVYHFPLVPRRYKDIKTFDDLKNFNEPNSEGLVLKFKDGYRIKFKTEEYKRLHRLITGVSERTVWEALKDNKLEELLEGTPDEFYNFVEEVKEDLILKFNTIHAKAILHFNMLPKTEDRKEFALAVNESLFPHKGILFRAYDKKPVSDMIWKLVRPEVQRVFKMISEDAN